MKPVGLLFFFFLALSISLRAQAAQGQATTLLDDDRSVICRVLGQVEDSQGQWRDESICSGTLISGEDEVGVTTEPKQSRYLLTAGHCDPAMDVKAKAPGVRRTLVQCPGGFESIADEFQTHPDYVADKGNPLVTLFGNDFSLVRLHSEIAVEPARLATKFRAITSSQRLHTCAFAGYGENNEGVLGKLSIIGANLSTRLSKDASAFHILSTPSARIVPGDSGGPVFCRTGGRGTPLLIAVNSYSYAKMVGVSHSVHGKIPWIRAVIKNWERHTQGLEQIEVENHIVHQERIQLCALDSAQSLPRGSMPRLTWVHALVTNCEYVLTRAQDAEFSDLESARAMINGIDEADQSSSRRKTKELAIARPGEYLLKLSELIDQSLARAGY